MHAPQQFLFQNSPPTNFASRRPLPKFGGKTFEARNAPSAHMRRWGVKSDKPSIASATQCPKSLTPEPPIREIEKRLGAALPKPESDK
jgi:hypothetical protein